MRPVSFGNPPVNIMTADPGPRFLFNALREIEKASLEGDTGTVADGFTVSNFTETRSLDASTATASDVANVLATFLNDLKKRGSKRT